MKWHIALHANIMGVISVGQRMEKVGHKEPGSKLSLWILAFGVITFLLRFAKHLG